MTLYLEAQSFILHQSLNLIINDTDNKQPFILDVTLVHYID